MKKNLTGLELKYIVAELQVLVGSKIAKVYQPSKKDICVQFYGSSTGKRLVRIIVPQFIYITEHRLPSPESPYGFCQSLRKNLGTGRLKAVKQIGLERIVEFVFETKDGDYRVIVELFGRGNAILCKGDVVVAVMESQRFKDRELKGRATYRYPKAAVDLMNLGLNDLQSLLKKTSKEDLVTFLAVEIGLGGLYAEETCRLCKLDKHKIQLEGKEIQILHNCLRGLIETKPNPMAIYMDGKAVDVVPFELQFYEEYQKELHSSYSEALDTVLGKEIADEAEAPNPERLKLEKILKMQNESIAQMEKEVEENQRMGEFVYENYQKIKEVLEGVGKDVKKLSREEILEKYKKSLIDVNLKDKTITAKI
jgi:predicted ribosome quality control (RQC) complex YloA/Tae2 family protein